jgi:hypothetical protein
MITKNVTNAENCKEERVANKGEKREEYNQYHIIIISNQTLHQIKCTLDRR